MLINICNVKKIQVVSIKKKKTFRRSIKHKTHECFSNSMYRMQGNVDLGVWKMEQMRFG